MIWEYPFGNRIVVENSVEAMVMGMLNQSLTFVLIKHSKQYWDLQVFLGSLTLLLKSLIYEHPLF